MASILVLMSVRYYSVLQIVDGGGGLTEIGECYLKSNGSNMKNL